MNGRVLTERLLATTSLAALILAATGQNSAFAVVPCPGASNPGGNYSNSGAIACVFIGNSSTASVTNTASGIIGPPTSTSAAIIVGSGGTLSGAISNAGRIVGPALTTGYAFGIAVAGEVRGGIGNSGTITVSTAGGAGFVQLYGIDIGDSVGGSPTSFGGGISNGGTISLTLNGGGTDDSYGIVEEVSTFSGNIINAAGGTIALSLTGATGLVQGAGIALFGDTVAGNVVNAGVVIASGISVGQAANITGVTISGGTVTGAITNSGTVSASATVSGGSDSAQAAGYRVEFIDSLGGGFANSGTIAASAINHGTGSAYAAGVGGFVYTWAGGFTNSGTISATASAGAGQASAIGVAIGNAFSTFTGGVLNSGTIAAVATSTGGAANANGLTIQGSLFSGGLSNAGTISASATVSAGTSEANAEGVQLINITSFGGGFANSGTIAAQAINNGTGTALAQGVYALIYNSAGGFNNSGIISATATANFGRATAVGLSIGAGAPISSFGGGILNSGTISASATGGDGATAYGMTLSGSLFTGNLSNGGTISATVDGGLGRATGTGIVISASSFNGAIVNSGNISGQATAVACCNAVLARGLAITSGVTFGTTSAGGGIVNSGTIAAVATVKAGFGCGTAAVRGLSVSVSTFNGGITNSGTIAATAQILAGAGSSNIARATALFLSGAIFNGGITNSGLISATATIASCGTAIARGISIFSGGAFNGGITNTGTIIAQASGKANFHCGSAIGIAIQGTGFSGNIVNSGTIAGLVTTSIGCGIGIAIGPAAHATITNSGLIEGTTFGIDLNSEGAASTINQTGGTIIGGICCGAAIRLSANADTVNISGGSIVGNIQGGGTANIVNVNMGSGTFSYAGQITNVGTVNLNSGSLLLQNLTAPGVSTVSYNQSAGTTLALEVSPAATNNHASLAASGAISLASGAVLQAFEGAFAWTPGTYTYAGVVTAGSTTGSFTAASNSPFFTASLSQSSTVDNLTLTMLSPSQVPGLNGNQQSVANAIIGIPGGNTTLDQIFLLPGSSSSSGPSAGLPTLGNALTQLSGSQFTTTNYQPLIQAWQMFTDSLSDRLSQGAGYGGTVSASMDPSHGIQFAQADIPQQVAQMSDGGSALRTAPMPHQWGLWARGYGLSSNASSTATSAAYSESGAGLIVGADNQITDRIVAGVALNVSSDKASVSGGGFTQTDAYQGSVYGQYSVDPNWYVNGIAGFGWQTYSSARVVTLLTTNVNNGNFDGQSYHVYGESGYTLHPAMLPLTRITPYLGLGYLHAHTDGFTETGSATALNVQAMDSNSFTTTLGARMATTFQIGATVFRPELRAAWQHEFLDESGSIRAAFAASPGSVFTATGTGFGRESFLGGAGLTTTITSSTQVFFDYDAKVTGGYTAQAVSGGLRVQF